MTSARAKILDLKYLAMSAAVLVVTVIIWIPLCIWQMCENRRNSDAKAAFDPRDPNAYRAGE